MCSTRTVVWLAWAEGPRGKAVATSVLDSHPRIRMEMQRIARERNVRNVREARATADAQRG